MNAHTLLTEASDTIKQRGVQRDMPDGERSMARCVNAFNALFGHKLTEAEGWRFMEILKISRSAGRAYNQDDFLDGAAYVALAAEAAAPKTPRDAKPVAPLDDVWVPIVDWKYFAGEPCRAILATLNKDQRAKIQAGAKVRYCDKDTVEWVQDEAHKWVRKHVGPAVVEPEIGKP